MIKIVSANITRLEKLIKAWKNEDFRENYIKLMHYITYFVLSDLKSIDFDLIKKNISFPKLKPIYRIIILEYKDKAKLSRTLYKPKNIVSSWSTENDPKTYLFTENGLFDPTNPVLYNKKGYKYALVTYEATVDPKRILLHYKDIMLMIKNKRKFKGLDKIELKSIFKLVSLEKEVLVYGMEPIKAKVSAISLPLKEENTITYNGFKFTYKAKLPVKG